MKTITLYDCEIACLTMEETLHEVESIIESKIYTQHVVLNASKVNLMEKDKKLYNIIKNCTLINADGQSIVWASRLFGTPLPERVAGIDLMERVIEMAAKKNYGVYFFGARDVALNSVIKHYTKMYPTLKISGKRNGYFKESENEEIVEEIRKSNADILLVAFSSPDKEYWLSKYGNNLNISFAMGVGGSFDVKAGVTKRAPVWMQKVGLEWFYRFSQEPRRMWKRYLIGNSQFVYYTLKKFITNSKKREI